MKIAFFDTHPFEKPFFEEANEKPGQTITFFETRLAKQTAELARGFDAVCVFVNDRLDSEVLKSLQDGGIRLVALRSAGFNNVDLEASARLGLRVVRVPEYSPYAVAEHAVGLILGLNRKLHRSYGRVREHNFSLEGLVGFDLHGKTVGVIGTGKIGAIFAAIMRGFGCKMLAYDLLRNEDLSAQSKVEYVELGDLFRRSDIISLHLPLTPKTRHIIDEAAIAQMRSGVMIINTGRGALIDSHALLSALKSGHIGYAGLDVYEEEEGVFFRDLSEQVLQDDVLARLLTFPNVLVTSHQAFLTHEALHNIATITMKNIADFEAGAPLVNEVRAERNLRGSSVEQQAKSVV